MPLPALIAAAPAIIQGVSGIAQLLSGAGKKAKRPEYEIPDSVKQSLALSKMQATSPYMAGYSKAKTNIDLSTANKVAAAGQYGNAQESLSGIMGQEASSLRNLDAANEEAQRKDVLNYQKSLKEYGSYEDLEFKLNKLDPYKDAAAEQRDIFGAGMENLFGAADKGGMLSGLMGGKSGGSGSGGGLGSLLSGAVSGATGGQPNISSVASGISSSASNEPEWMRILRELKNRPY